MDLEYVQRIAVAAAIKGARVLHSFLGNIDHVKKKGSTDLVTQADTESENVIIETIRNRFPDHTILTEERGLIEGDAAYQWVIDPLDGTTNFVHELGFFAVSIAFALNGETVVGIVMNPETGELFSSIKDHGSTLNGHPINVSNTEKVCNSLLVTGFPYNVKTNPAPVLARFGNCLKAAQGIRRLGSATLDLCYTACGRFDGFWEQGLHPWDTAAGELIAREAGAVVTDFKNNPFSVDMKEILATNGKIHESMLFLLKLADLK